MSYGTKLNVLFTVIILGLIFVAQCNAIMVYAVIVFLSVCLFVTSQCSAEMAKHKFVKIVPHCFSDTDDFNETGVWSGVTTSGDTK